MDVTSPLLLQIQKVQPIKSDMDYAITIGDYAYPQCSGFGFRDGWSFQRSVFRFNFYVSFS